jgi:hypothetical protein
VGQLMQANGATVPNSRLNCIDIPRNITA